MSIVRNLFVLGTLSALPLMSQAQTTAGSTPGSFRVTESGAAEYRIPIRLPPGIAGMEPKLALVYNSQAGNGLLGMGWNLEGFSAITRCPRTIAQDGTRGAVTYDWTDRYCLDGQRLVLVSGASYGADGAEYRTERESFSKVVSYGVTANGPVWFKVWTKAGQIVEYGNTPSSSVEAVGLSAVRIWAVSSVSDTRNNRVSFSYIKDAGDFRVQRIDYTTNAGVTSGASVQFEYDQTRTDVSPAFVGGRPIRIMARLTHVRAFLGTSLVRDYRLTYEQAPATRQSRITSIQECAGDGTCLVASSFQWQEPSASALNVKEAFLSGSWVQEITSVKDYQLSGDRIGVLFYNGDLWVKEGSLYGNWVAEASAVDRFQLSGDRIAILQNGTLSIKAGGLESGWVVFAGDVESFQLSGNRVGYLQNSVLYTKEGDLYAPLVGHIGGVESFQLSGSRIAMLRSGTLSVKDGDQYGPWVVFAGDVDRVQMDGNRIAYTVNGTLYAKEGDLYAPLVQEESGVMDFQLNGARLGILQNGVLSVKEGSLWESWVVEYWGISSFQLEGDRIGILQGQVVSVKEGSLYSNWVQLGQGQAFSLLGSSGTFNRIGVRDVSVAPDVLTAITDSSLTSVSYASTSGGNVYVAGNSAAYPMVDLRNAMTVVSSVAVANGVGGTRVTRYSYSGAQADLRGRGFAGFSAIDETDDATGIVTHRLFAQNFPYAGVVTAATRQSSSGQILSQNNVSFGCTDFVSQTGCADTPGRRYFVSAAQTVEQARDLNGTVLPTVTTTTQYDLFGNATNVAVSTGDGYSKTTTNVYNNDATNWLLGRLKSSSVQSTTP